MKDVEIKNFIVFLKKSKVYISIFLFLSFVSKSIYFLFQKKFRKKSIKRNLVNVSNYDSIIKIFPPFEIKKIRVGSSDPHIVFRANQILNGSWFLASRSFEFQDNVKWDLKFSDEQDYHLLHRHRELVYVLYAFLITKDLKFFNYIQFIIEDWIDKNYKQLDDSWHPYTTSERVIYWTWILKLLPFALIEKNIKWYNKVLKSLFVQSEFINKNIEFHLGIHNHLLNNARALLNSYSLFQNSECEKWLSNAIDILNDFIPKCVRPDGSVIDDSSSYQLLITYSLFECKQLYGILGKKFKFDVLLNSMVNYCKALLRSNYSIPVLGHISPDWEFLDISGKKYKIFLEEKEYHVSLLSLIFKELYNLDFLFIPNNEKIFGFISSGVCILKRGNVHLTLSQNQSGELGIHGDQNSLGLTLSINNFDIIRDLGLKSYNYDDARIFSESWRGQSNFSLNNLNPVVSSWRQKQLPKKYYNFNSKIETDYQTFLFCESTHFNRIFGVKKVSRKLYFVNEKEIDIEDYCCSISDVLYTAHFHFGDLIVKKDLSLNKIQLFSDLNCICDFFFDSQLALSELKLNFCENYGENKLSNSFSFSTIIKEKTIKYKIKINL